MKAIYLKTLTAVLLSVGFLPSALARPGAGTAANRSRTIREGNPVLPFLSRNAIQSKETVENQNKIKVTVRGPLDPLVDRVMYKITKPLQKLSAEKRAEVVKKLVEATEYAKRQKKDRLYKELVAVAEKHPLVGQSLVEISSVVVNGRVSNEKRADFRSLLQFAANMKEISPLAAHSVSVTPSSVVLKLGMNIGDMVEWTGPPHKNVMDLVRGYNKHRKLTPGPGAALTAALKDRGYNDIELQLARMQDIQKNCKRG